MWSFSADRIFRQCQRQWYFHNVVRSATARNDLRHEAYLLSKMQSIAAWRGQLVDDVISKYIIVALNRKQSLSMSGILKEAKRLFDLQVEFALAHRIREPGISPSKVGEAFAAFIPVEYGATVNTEELQNAWLDVENALKNLTAMDEVKAILKGSTYRIAQRALQLKIADASVRSVPDVIAFNNEDTPIILDWKVHQFGRADYRLQLALYALCLTGCNPHSDFPPFISRSPSGIRLLEVQLLTCHVREHRVTEDDIDELEEYIATSALEMRLARGAVRTSDFNPEEFMAALSPLTCTRCVFRKLCWEGHNGTN